MADPTFSDLQKLRSEKQPTFADLQSARQKSKPTSSPTEDPEAYTANILPLRHDKSGLHLAVPGIVQGIIDTAKAPGDVLTGKIQPGPEMEEKARDFAGMVAGMDKAPEVIEKTPLKEIPKSISEASKKTGEALSEHGSTLKTGFHAKTREELEGIAKNMRNEASGTLKEMKDMGATLGKGAGQSLSVQVKKAVEDIGILNKKRHADTIAALRDLDKDLKSGPITLEKLEDHRQALREVIKDNTTKLEGANSEVPRAQAALDAIDDALDNLVDHDFTVSGPEAVAKVKQYRQQWARARRFERVSDAISTAEGDADKIKSNLDRLVKKKGALNGFSDEEKEAIKKLAGYSLPEKALKGVGITGLNPAKKNFNAFVPAIETMAGAAHMPYALPIGALGTAANIYRNYLTRGQAEQLLGLIQGMK